MPGSAIEQLNDLFVNASCLPTISELLAANPTGLALLIVFTVLTWFVVEAVVVLGLLSIFVRRLRIQGPGWNGFAWRLLGGWLCGPRRPSDRELRERAMEIRAAGGSFDEFTAASTGSKPIEMRSPPHSGPPVLGPNGPRYSPRPPPLRRFESAPVRGQRPWSRLEDEEDGRTRDFESLAPSQSPSQVPYRRQQRGRTRTYGLAPSEMSGTTRYRRDTREQTYAPRETEYEETEAPRRFYSELPRRFTSFLSRR